MQIPMTEEEWAHKVALINTEAANYMLAREGREPLREYYCFSFIFPWRDTPQGVDYWSNIYRRLAYLP